MTSPFRIAHWSSGQVLEDAGLEILTVEQPNHVKTLVVYKVKMLCCGTVTTLDGTQISHRGRRAARKCAVCHRPGLVPKPKRKPGTPMRGKQTGPNPDSIKRSKLQNQDGPPVIWDGPTWPVPSGQPLGPYFWGGDGSIVR